MYVQNGEVRVYLCSLNKKRDTIVQQHNTRIDMTQGQEGYQGSRATSIANAFYEKSLRKERQETQLHKATRRKATWMHITAYADPGTDHPPSRARTRPCTWRCEGGATPAAGKRIPPAAEGSCVQHPTPGRQAMDAPRCAGLAALELCCGRPMDRR